MANTLHSRERSKSLTVGRKYMHKKMCKMVTLGTQERPRSPGKQDLQKAEK